ncbi:hypothetical protein DND132_2251 [Pseudodesulfovibrio mercurii]|uniref:Uncharacterized protein n=1 Tax=Pseudodesulfovibrio mercurii TaxID=641491 RepID=F0JIM1_9BACT|nr:hypothetical protein [Pseudodesulfovibrio mercurii]EGB15455.1 hypothetical protein DND132_2251 [Pseudodesulfovibrio mercurii]
MRRACLTLLWVLALAAPLAAGTTDDLSELFPASVGPLERVGLVTGDEAQTEVDKLHGKALRAEASAIAHYAEQGGRPAEAWVSRVASEAEARRQTGLMVHKMFENPRSPFSHPSRVDHNGVAVYRFTGMGRAHLIWYAGDLVWWVSADPDRERDFLDALCR